MSECCDPFCFRRVDGQPVGGGAGGVNGTYYNFSNQEGTNNLEILSFIDTTSPPTFNDSETMLVATQTGTLGMAIMLVADLNAGATDVNLYLNESSTLTATTSATDILAGVPTELLITGVAITEGDRMRIGVDPTTAPGGWTGYVLVGYA